MSIKGWFEKKIAERKATAAAKKAMMKATKAETHRFSNHEASKKGHRHHHGRGFITRWIVKDPETRVKTVIYWHRPGWDAEVMSNHMRVVFGRQQRIPNYIMLMED